MLKYLAPYVYRVAISDNRIVACDESSVTYCYTPSGTQGRKDAQRRQASGSSAAFCSTSCRAAFKRFVTTAG